MNWLQVPTYSASMMGTVKPLKFMHLKSKTIIGARMNLELKLKKLIRIAFKDLLMPFRIPLMLILLILPLNSTLCNLWKMSTFTTLDIVAKILTPNQMLITTLQRFVLLKFDSNSRGFQYPEFESLVQKENETIFNFQTLPLPD